MTNFRENLVTEKAKQEAKSTTSH